MPNQINMQVSALAFSDTQASNNPRIRNFDLTFALQLVSNNPSSRLYTLAPGEERVIYDGTRANTIDGTSEFTVTRPDLTKNVYRFTRTAGTAAAFRTDRATTVSTSTTFAISVNGPVATMTATAGPFVTTNIVVGDQFKAEAGAGMSAANQGRFTIISKTSTSISFKNLNVAAETFTVLDAAKLYFYSNGGGTSNQAQINDTVVISAGFSPATFGSYKIQEVTPEWIEILAGETEGIPLESAIIPGAAGLAIYDTAKKFALIAAQDKMSVKFNAETADNCIVEPVEKNNPEKSAVLLKTGSYYRIAVKNLSLSPADVTVASGE